jgi:hypothetical protein
MKAKGKPQNQTNNSDKKISKEVSSMDVVLEKAVQLEDNKTAQLETELNSKTQQYDALNTEMQVMREMMKMLLANNSQQQVQHSTSSLDNRVVVGSNIMGKETLMPDKHREIAIDGFKDKVTISIEDANMIMGQIKYRKLFQNGLFYFDDKKWYEYFNIHPSVVLNDEGIMEVLTLPEVEMKKRLNDVTENKTNEITMHSLMVRVAYLLKNNKLNIGFDKMPILDEYFKAKLSTMMVLIELVE